VDNVFTKLVKLLSVLMKIKSTLFKEQDPYLVNLLKDTADPLLHVKHTYF